MLSSPSLSEVFRSRHYASGYVYIAGSLSGRVIKIGTAGTIRTVLRQRSKLRSQQYGSLSDWVILYYVRVGAGGMVEHDARRTLHQYWSPRMYLKDGSWQRAREIVRCSFSVAHQALDALLGDDERAGA